MRGLLHLYVITAAVTLVSPVATAQEYFGEFLDSLKGAFIVEAKPRPLFKIETDFRFKDPNGLLWSTPAGTSVDGASIPQFFWSFIGGPFEGPYINASVIHDYYCQTKERTAHDTHRNFYYGMRASQVPEWKASLMHWAVSTFGPSWMLERRIVMKQTCASPPGLPATCSSVPASEVVLVTSPPIDLSDPDVLAAAISKTNAVARTLLTSNGKVLDVTAVGPVRATVEGIEASANAYRQVFASKEFSSSPARLGLLSQATGRSLADVQPWAGNRIPTLNDAVVLTPQTVPKVEASVPFKLDPRS
jgi:Protein of unknown function (DUF1353)